MEEALGFVLFVLLVDELAACAPPFGDAVEVAAIEPEAVGATAVDDDAAAAAEDGLGHALIAGRALAIAGREILSVDGIEFTELLEVQPDDGIHLCLEDEFQFSGIEKEAVARGAALDGDGWLEIELNDVQRALAAWAGHGGVVAEIAEVDLPQIDVWPHAAVRAKFHRALQAATAVLTFHKSEHSKFGGWSQLEKRVCFGEGNSYRGWDILFRKKKGRDARPGLPILKGGG